MSRWTGYVLLIIPDKNDCRLLVVADVCGKLVHAVSTAGENANAAQTNQEDDVTVLTLTCAQGTIHAA